MNPRIEEMDNADTIKGADGDEAEEDVDDGSAQ